MDSCFFQVFFRSSLVSNHPNHGYIHSYIPTIAMSDGYRPFPVAERWAELVLKEFALQGEEEKVGDSGCEGLSLLEAFRMIKHEMMRDWRCFLVAFFFLKRESGGEMVAVGFP